MPQLERIVHFALAVGLVACGKSEKAIRGTGGLPGQGGDSSSGGAGNEGQGGDSISGGAAGNEVQACSQLSRSIKACVIQPAGFVKADEPVDGLTAIGTVPADPVECSHALPPGSDTVHQIGARTGLAFENSDGERWIVIPSIPRRIEDLPDELLVPGEAVSLDYAASYLVGGWVLVMHDDEIALAVFNSIFPVSLMPRLWLAPVTPECSVEPCWMRSSVRISFDGSSAVLGTDESAPIGNLVFVNDYYEQLLPCTEALPSYFMIAAYRPSG